MTVTWTTYKPTPTLVQYGTKKDSLNLETTGNFTTFVDNGNRTHYIHRVRLVKLNLKTTYYYKCGSEKGEMSKVFKFKTLTDSTDWKPTMIVYGDLGVSYGETIPYLIQEAENGTVDVVFHNGDFAYDLGTDNSKLGDTFMRLMEPMATLVPYQTSIGNHETGSMENYINYMNRFTMRDMIAETQQENNVHYYTFFLGSALMISINNEIYIKAASRATMKPEFKQEQEDWL
ncbi:PREDICTED: acid phosphatase type 7-like, partial [Rhagoletis zephyria]|uniref:acid phosphatase type 7-like n=1 Tax=Rhagoletis zephyria TaxID=28612 RepID=UPI0008116ADE